MFAEKTNITPLENKQIRDSVDKWADEELTRRKNVESDILNKDINTIQDRYSHVLDEITDHLKGVKSSLDEKISYNRSQIDKWKEDINALTSKYNIGKPGYGIGYKAYELAKEIVDIDMKPLKDPVGDMERRSILKEKLDKVEKEFSTVKGIINNDFNKDLDDLLKSDRFNVDLKISADDYNTIATKMKFNTVYKLTKLNDDGKEMVVDALDNELTNEIRNAQHKALQSRYSKNFKDYNDYGKVGQDLDTKYFDLVHDTTMDPTLRKSIMTQLGDYISQYKSIMNAISDFSQMGGDTINDPTSWTFRFNDVLKNVREIYRNKFALDISDDVKKTNIETLHSAILADINGAREYYKTTTPEVLPELNTRIKGFNNRIDSEI